jgi:hypothetical protein
VKEFRQTKEPTVQPLPSPVEERLNRALERVASVLTSIVALGLILFVVLALVSVAMAAVKPVLSHRDFARGAIDGLDGAFLVIILLELVHTTLSRGPVTRQVQEFLVVGITVGVRSGLEIAAVRGGDLRALPINLAINALGVLILVAALWLVRRLDRDRDGNS